MRKVSDGKCEVGKKTWVIIYYVIKVPMVFTSNLMMVIASVKVFKTRKFILLFSSFNFHDV